MEKENVSVEYDKEEDMLYIGRDSSHSQFSVDIELPQGEVVIDYASDGRIAGIEFLNASNMLPILKSVEPSNLKAKLSVQYGAQWAQIYFEIRSPQLQQPIMNSIISPYNKKKIIEH
ncbi:MAG: DUF2283 domain-containing protein [Nanoarchaeota archaeon]